MTGLERLLQQLSANQQPTFRPTAIEGLLKPQQAEIKPYSPETFQPGLLNQPSTSKQLGLIGASFAPGAGFSDFAGTFPSAQGGTEPSAAQNLQQGNYLTSALQTLGAFGDAATATGAALGPLGLAAGMGVGSIAKAPRAAQKGVQGLIDTVKPKLDELGFFSQVEKSVMDIPQQKGTGQQFLAQIQKTPGVKPEELQYTGLDTFLANKPTVTKGEIQDYLDTNRVQVQEVTLGGRQPFDAKKLRSLENDYLTLNQHPIDDPSFGEEKYDEMIKLMNIRDQSSTTSLYSQADEAMRLGQKAQSNGNKKLADKYFKDYELFNTRAEKLDLQDLGLENPTKFSEYTIPGGENYREVLLTLPAKQMPNRFTLRNNESGGTVGSFDTMEEAQEFMQTTPRNDIRSGNFSLQETTSGTEPVYQSSHFDQPNILAHMRVNDRTIDGKPTMFVEEIQSDWHQAGRKKGYQGQNEFAKLEKQLNDLQAQKRSLQANPEANQDIFGNLEAALAGQDTQISPETSAYFEKITDLDARIADLGEKISGMAIGVPDAPFKTSWDELSLKRAIKMASDEGYEQIGFTTGKAQSDRYPGDEKRSAGMETFYDKMVPKKLEKIGKKYGAKPTKSTMQTPDGDVDVWKFNIPKEMRETVKEQGQPLFQIGVGGAGLGAAGLLGTEEEQY